MTEIENKKTIGFALTGSYCTFEKVFEYIPALCQTYNILPIISSNVFNTDTRFGTSAQTTEKLERITGNQVISTIAEAEPIGPKELLDLLIIAPCTGNTLAKLALGITDTPVAMAYKAHRRNGRPVLIGVSTNDGLSASAPNIARLLNTKGVFFIPFGQDSPNKKCTSLISHFDLMGKAVEAAFHGKQLQPILKEYA